METEIKQTPAAVAGAPPAAAQPHTYSRGQILAVMSSVLLGILLAALDQTIVGPALPRIIADLQGFDRYAWVVTIYLLTSTITVPIVGKLSDMYGRKWLYLSGIVVFHCFVPCEGNKRTLFSLFRHSRRVPIHRWKREQIGHIQILTTRRMQRILERRGLHVVDTTFSFHLLGQIHDLFDYWRRDTLSRDDIPVWRKTLTKAISRAVFIPTWRLAYYEDTLLKHFPAAIGVHITCVDRR